MMSILTWLVIITLGTAVAALIFVPLTLLFGGGRSRSGYDRARSRSGRASCAGRASRERFKEDGVYDDLSRETYRYYHPYEF